jgi:hypothetical protein
LAPAWRSACPIRPGWVAGDLRSGDLVGVDRVDEAPAPPAAQRLRTGSGNIFGYGDESYFVLSPRPHDPFLQERCFAGTDQLVPREPLQRAWFRGWRPDDRSHSARSHNQEAGATWALGASQPMRAQRRSIAARFDPVVGDVANEDMLRHSTQRCSV